MTTPTPTAGRGPAHRRAAHRAFRGASLVAGALLAAWAAPASAQSLSLSAGTSYTGTSVAAGTAQQPVVRFKLTAGASGGAVSVSAIRMTSSGTANPVCPTCTASPPLNPSILRLLLFQDSNGNGTIDVGEPLVGRAYWDPSLSRYVFSRLAVSVAQGATASFVAAASLASGANPGATFNFAVAPADVVASVATGGSSVTGASTAFTVAAGPAEGDSTASSTAPAVTIVNPVDGGVVGGTFLVQARVFAPSGVTVTGVTLSFNSGGTYPCTLAQNANYPAETNVGMWQAQVSVVSTTPAGCQVNAGGASLKARVNGLATATSSLAVVAALDPTAAPNARGDGNLLVRDDGSQICGDCHAIKSHSSENTTSKYGSWTTTCRDCHKPHNTTNIYLVAKNITPPAVASYQPAQQVNFSTTTGDSGASYTGSTASFANADASGPCQVCHTRTKNQSTSAARWRNAASGGNADAHYTAAAGTQPCVNCHTHTGGFAASESPGGISCGSCHSDLFNPMNGTTTGYHHYLNNTNTGYPAVASIGGTADTNRKCLMCHVDHDIFRPDIDTANGGRGKNLRTDINTAPTTSANFTNTDFDNALTRGGICLSCHTAQQTKSYTQTDGSTTTPAIAQATFNSSAHDYTVPATFAGTLTNTFNGNCSKCHTDNRAKSKQTSAYPAKFGLHDSAQRRITHPLGDTVLSGTASSTPSGNTLSDTTQAWTANQLMGYSVTITSGSGSQTGVVASNTATQLTVISSWSPAPSGTTTYVIDDPAEERFCQNCHSGGLAGTDAYGVQAMSQDSKRLGQFLNLYGAGTISAATGTGTSLVTGTGTTWLYTGTGGAFTNGSSSVTGITVSIPSTPVGWTLKNTTAGSINYTIVGYNSSTSTAVISPSYREATGTAQSWSISTADWYLRCGADTNGLWYRIISVASATSLTIYPSYATACSGAYVARSAPGHPMEVTAGVHRPDEGTASGWNGGGTTVRHVTCNDCHDVHAAQAGDHVPGSTSTANMAAANTGAWGVSVTYAATRSATGTFTSASKTVTTSASFFLSTDVGKNLTGPDGVIYPITAYTSGTSVSIGNTAGYKGTTGSGTFTIEDPVTKPTLAMVSPLSTANTQAQLCLKCHGPYGYGTNVPKTSFFDTSGNGAAGSQTDVSDDFNPGQLSHHAVFAIGNNQPPATANPNWATSAGRKATTWAGGANPASGLDNNFVDGWGAKSIVTCADCHSADSPEDPWGPHGSANQWMLKGINPNVTVTIAGGTVTKPNNCYYKGSTNVYGGVPDTGDSKNLCLNCHRADVYGLLTSGGQSTGSYCSGTTMTTGILYANFARVDHPVDGNSNSNSASASALTRWGIYCMQCHGGRSLGAIHGTNNLLGPTGGASYEGKRFLTGAVWHGVTRASTATAVQCWFANGADAQVNNCSHSHSGTGGNKANYDYDSGAD